MSFKISITGSSSFCLRIKAIFIAHLSTSFSATKYSFLSPAICFLYTIPYSTNCLILILALPLDITKRSIISSVDKGLPDERSRACTCATDLLIPHSEPKAPQVSINCCFASANSIFSFLIQFYNSKIIKVFVFSKNIENKIIYFLRLFRKSRGELQKNSCNKHYNCFLFFGDYESYFNL